MRTSIPFTILVSLILASISLNAPPLNAQNTACDTLLTQPVDNPNGYRLRSDRCEGIYIKEVHGTLLHLASFTEYFEDYDLTANKNLTVKWTPFDSNGISLRAWSLKRKVYYRMDTQRSAIATSYSWPANILAAVDLSKKDLGVLGWTWHKIGADMQKVYLPLRISQKEQPQESGVYRLILLPGVELEEVYITLARVGADGNPEKYIRDEEPLEFGYYPAGRALPVPVSGMKESGIYYLDIGATLSGGGSDNVEMWFYFTGN